MLIRSAVSRKIRWIVIGLAVASGSNAFAYESNRLFFQYERARADIKAGIPSGFEPARQSTFPYKVTRSGVPLKVNWYDAVTPDCRSEGTTQVNIVSMPQHGQVSTSIGNEFPAFPATNTHSSCNRTRVASTRVFYKSVSGFVGTDRFTVEAVFPSGNARRSTFTISVR